MPNGPQLAVAFRDVDPAQGLRVVPSLLERAYSMCLLVWRIPDFLVYPSRLLALVFRHSSYGKGFAAKRVGQQTLQELVLCPICLPVLPSRYALGADAHCGGRLTSRWCASSPQRGKLHQQTCSAVICFASLSVCQVFS